MKKTISFGKIDYNRTGRKINLVDVDIELKEVTNVTTIDLKLLDKAYVFSASAGVWNSKQTDYIACGQMLDELNMYIGNRIKFHKILKFWKKYHLNDMNAGTSLQMEALKKWRKENNITDYDYTKECEYLKSINLYEDRGYKYGHGWLLEEIPENDLNEIKKLFL
jgi:hypothetical protein